MSWSPNQIFFTEIFFGKIQPIFDTGKMALKLRLLKSLTRLFIILVSLKRSLFSEKMFITNRCMVSAYTPTLKEKF